MAATIQHHDITWNQMNKPKFYTIGTSFFFGIRLALYPSSLIKTIVQSSPHQSSNAVLKELIAKRKIAAFYKGFPITAIGAVPGQMIYLTVYEKTKSLFGAEFQLLGSAIGGFLASISSQLIVVPVDIISQKQMISGHNKMTGINEPSFMNSRQVIANIMQKQGVMGLYRGFLSSIMTYAPSSGIWWTCYSFSKKMLSGHSTTKGELYLSGRELSVSAASGCFAGFCSGLLTNPMDVIKTRIQTLDSKDSIRKMIRDLNKLEGNGRWIFKGVLPRIIYMAPVSCLMIISYEWVKKLSLENNKSV